MFRRGYRLLDFRTQKINDIGTAVIARKDNKYDHVVFDMGGYLATGLRICRDLVGPERDSEISKYVMKNVLNPTIKKLRANKSVTLLFDGTEPLWKLRRTRKVPHKSTEGRFSRSAASTLPYIVEEYVRGALMESPLCPPEVIISGAATPGPVEAKFSAWGLDLAARSDVTANDSIVVLGGTDLFISNVALTPFHHLTNMTMDRGDYKQTSFSDVCDWLNITEILQSGNNVALTRVRTDITLLYLLSNGISSSALSTLPNAPWKELLDVYLEHFAKNEKWLTCDVPRADDQLPGVTVGVKPAVLANLLARVTKKSPKPKIDKHGAADFVEVLLQSHAMLIDGGIKNMGYVPLEPLEAKPLPVQPERVIAHLSALDANKPLTCTVDPSFAFTPCEQLLAGSITTEMIQSSLPAFSGGHTLPPNVAESLVQKDSITDALEVSRKLLRANKSTHRAMSHSPTHFWKRAPGEGPPPGWAYFSVNLGIKSQRAGTRAELAAKETSGAVVGIAKKHALIGFESATGVWTERDTAIPGQQPPQKLSIVTWNVQFDRFSGQTTPLGKPGIDWCSKTRYVALSKVLSTTGADIIAMQETEPTWWDFLSKQAWVQKNYMFNCGMRAEALTPWGQLLLVKKSLNVTNMNATNVPGYTGHTSVMPQCTVGLGGGSSLTVCGIHLLAPYTQSNVNVRVTQVETLMKKLSPKHVGGDVMVMGDFNDYPSNFFVMPPAMGNFRDAWVEQHGSDDADAGYTINGRTSKYTSLIIEPEFFGRADRILFKSEKLKTTGAKLLGTKSVREELGIASCPEYLFPSDHYGIHAEFDVTA